MKVDYKVIGRRIREARKLRLMSQAELAELTGLSAPYICCIETARKKASLQSLVSISSVLGTTVDRLLGGNRQRDNGCRDEISMLMEDCSEYERYVIYAQMISLKEVLRESMETL